MKYKSLLFPVLFMMFIFVSSVSAAELVLQPDGATGKDALITSGNGTDNYVTYLHLVANLNNATNHGLIEFDLSAIPDNVTIDSATLELRENSNCSFNQNNIEVHLNSGEWDETTVTWDNAPPYGAAIVLNAGETSSCEWLIFDVTSTTQNWSDGSVPNNGFRITGPAGANVIKSIYSSDYTDPANRPILKINYTVSSGAIPTLNEWGMMIFSLLMAGAAFWFIRKERHKSC